MNLKLWLCSISFLIGVAAVFSFGAGSRAYQREPYNIELPKIAVGFNDTTKICNRVRITFHKSDDYVIISENDDAFVKTNRNGVQKTVYREFPEKSYQLTDFEVEQINKVCKIFVETLDQFEKNLHNNKWGRCSYLDAYFPNFLNGFYYLMLEARNSTETIPEEAKIPESLYDVSLNSVKTDDRIRKWQANKEHIVSLRIAIKELIFQIKEWQKKELTNSKRNHEISQDSQFFKALIFFERVYFNKIVSTQHLKN